MNDKNNKGVTLHYIDKLYNALIATEKSMNRTILLLIVISLIVIALTVGIITIGQEIAFGGFKLKVAPWLLPYMGAWIIGVLFLKVIGLADREAELENTIIRLYKSLGYNDKSLEKMRFELPPIFTNFLSQILSRLPVSIFTILLGILFLGAVQLLIFCVPFIAEILTAYILIRYYFGWTFWIIMSYVILLGLPIGYLLIALKYTLTPLINTLKLRKK